MTKTDNATWKGDVWIHDNWTAEDKAKALDLLGSSTSRAKHQEDPDEDGQQQRNIVFNQFRRNASTNWKADNNVLNAGGTVNLHWNSPENVKFKVAITLDENYLFTSGYQIEEGRNITTIDAESNTRVVLLGKEVAKTLFGERSGLNKVISIGGGKYKVIGILKEKGNASGFGGDRTCILPMNVGRQQFPSDNRSFQISILVKNTMN